MRKVLRHTREVFHFWANQVQDEGRSGNVYFEGPYVYSYGPHFCIARILPNNTVVMTTRGYSPTTSGHIREARSATSHLRTVYTNNPRDSVFSNMAFARRLITGLLDKSEAKGIRQTTRDARKAEALQAAYHANAYLAALPEEERGSEVPIDTTSLESVRETLRAAEAAIVREREAERVRMEAHYAERLVEWRAGGPHAYGLSGLPVALRLNRYLASLEGESFMTGVVETSHGAEIPVEDAIALWPLIQRTMRGHKDFTPGQPIGNYRLTQIKSDGSLVVGCHNVAYKEIEAIAVSLGLVTIEEEVSS